MPSDYVPASRRSDRLLGLSAVVAFACFAVFFTLEQALAYTMVVGVFLTIIQTKPKPKRNKRFWIIMSILALVHIVALLFLQIPKFRFGAAAAPFAFVDGFAIWGLLSWIERRFPVQTGNIGSK